MKDRMRRTDFTADERKNRYSIANEIELGKYKAFLREKTMVLFFQTGIRTRDTFEKESVC